MQYADETFIPRQRDTGYAMIEHFHYISTLTIHFKHSHTPGFVSTSSVARGGGGGGGVIDQNAEWEKHYVFSTFETVL